MCEHSYNYTKTQTQISRHTYRALNKGWIYIQTDKLVNIHKICLETGLYICTSGWKDMKIFMQIDKYT